MDRNKFYSQVAELADKPVAEVSRICKVCFFLIKKLPLAQWHEVLNQIEDTDENFDKK